MGKHFGWGNRSVVHQNRSSGADLGSIEKPHISSPFVVEKVFLCVLGQLDFSSGYVEIMF